MLEYNDFVNENTTSINDMNDMMSISSYSTGIKNVVLWIGPNEKYNFKIIKISNILKGNIFERSKNSFILTIPDFKIIGKRDEHTITDNILNDIKNFLKINELLIEQLYNGEIIPSQFAAKLKSIK